MSHDPSLARCSRCGAMVPRDDMFGIEPDLLCERCAMGDRTRLAPKPVGRLASSFGGKPTPITLAVLLISAGLFLLTYVVYAPGNHRPPPDWLFLLFPHGATQGEWWRLITSAFLHGGWLHIIFNSMWVWSLGRAVESTRGSLRFLAIFLGSAAFASAAQIYFGKGAGIGLSGVLYALAGYLWIRRKEDAVAASVMNPYTARMLGAWLVLCFFLPGLRIANGAHAGGLAWGLVAGWVSTREKGPKRWAAVALLAVLTIAAVLWVTTGHTIRTA